MEAGFLKLSRKFFASDIWKAHREFSDSEAYLDILQSASYDKSGKELKAIVNGREISYSYGQFPASLSLLQKRWNWKSTKRVRCFLDKLARHGIITIDKAQGVNVITVCDLATEKTLQKVSRTQRGAQCGHSEGHNVDTAKDTNNKNYKELKNKDKEKTSTIVDVKKKADKSATPTSELSVRYQKFRSWLESEYPYIVNHFEKTISEKEFERLIDIYSTKQICDTISEINNRSDLRKKYTDLYRTVLNWLKRENIPKQ